MNRKLNALFYMMLFLFCYIPNMSAQTSDDVLQKQFGKQTVTLTKEQDITFYDFMGSEPIKGDVYNNVQSLTVFKPIEKNYRVQIIFEYLNLESHSEKCPHFLNIYDGEADADNSFVWAEGPFDVTEDNCSLPSGEQVRMEGSYTSYVYTSSSADGQLSVGHLCRMGKSSEGWKARVRCVPAGEMQITSAGTSSDKIKEVPACKYNVPFISFYVDAEGTDNADALRTIKFHVLENEKAADVTRFRFYPGDASGFDLNHEIQSKIKSIGNGEYSAALDYPLQSGRNVITLVGSFYEESKVNSKLSFKGIGINTDKYPSGYPSFNNQGKITVLVPPVEYMREGHTTIGIGDIPIMFYDNGGPGKMSSITEGITTFVPEKKGYKIKIDFKDVKLHKTEYSDKSEEIRIYNGSTVDERYLVKVLTETQTAVVHSTADDGALTIVYRDNNAGTYYKQDGFEAVVSSFSPTEMKLTSASAELLGGEVCGGEKNFSVLQIILHTQNTEPALQAQNFEFVTNGTYKHINSATLYYCGRKADMNEAVCLGTVGIKGDTFTITASETPSLVEGDNYFMLVYDINPEANDGDKISAEVTHVTLSGIKYDVTNNTENKTEVNNTVYSEEGRHEIVVSGRKPFRTRMHSSGETHMPGTEDQIITFYPAHEGMKMQIDFNSLDLYYSSLAYDTHCTFEIYRGTIINDITLLWKVDSEKSAHSIPSEIIRSDSEDGALTIVFNPNTFTTASCGKGFDAEVFEYCEQPMQLEDVIVKQITNDNVKAGDENVKILDVNVRTMGSADDYTFDAMNINLKGSEKEISRVSVYDSYSDTPLAESIVTSSDSEVVLKFKEEILKDGDNHYFICFDVKNNAAETAVIDAAVTSVTITGSEVKVKAGDPEGFIRLRNIFNLSDGDNAEIIVAAGSPVSFYDAGGVDGTCGTNFNGTVTFAPADKNDVITLTFKNWNVAYGDEMNIYHGAQAVGTPDYTFEMKDKDLSGRVIISKSADGKITVNFKTDYNDSEGYEIEVRSCKREDLKIAAMTAESIVDEPLFKGSEDVPVMKIQVSVEGNSNPFDITSLVFDRISDKTVRALHVYATGMDEGMFATCPFGSGTKEIMGSYNISEPGNYNFFVTVDINTSSAVGDEVEIHFSSVNDISEDTRFFSVIKKGLSGTFKVGRDEKYTSIQDAIDEIKEGIDGPVTISIEPGVYTVENLNIPHIRGGSSENRLTITSSTGNSSDVCIFGNNFNKPLEYEDYYGVVTLDGANYVTLKNLEITTDDKQYPSVVRVKNHSCHVTVDSCYIHAETVTGYKDKIILVETYSKLEEGQNTDYLTVSNCMLEGARIGVRFAGASSIYLSDQCGNILVNNVFRNQGMIGVYGVDISDIVIKGNKIINEKTDAGEFKAVDLNIDKASGNVEVSGNIINITAGTKQTLMQLRNMNCSADAPARIFNNQLSGVGGQEMSHALLVSGDVFQNVEFAYNSMMMNGKSVSSLIFLGQDKSDNISFVNNIMSNRNDGVIIEREGTDFNGMRFAADVFSCSGEKVVSVGNVQYTFTEFVKLTGAEDCYKENIVFFSDDVLEPMEQGCLLNARNIDYVGYDITGIERDKLKPTIGAYEFVVSPDAPLIIEGYPKAKNVSNTSADVVVKTNMSGRVYAMALKTDIAAPSADSLITEGRVQNVVRNAEHAITVKQLEKGSEYIIYVIPENKNGVCGTVYSTDRFVAEGEGHGIPEDLIIKASDIKTEAGAETVLSASVSGGMAPYAIVWHDNMNNVVKEETLTEEGMTEITASSDECNDFIVSVTDACGTAAKTKVRMIITGEAVTATFENLYLAPESYWNGNDLSGSFVSGSYKFANSYEPDFMSWGGFSYSNVTETEFTGYLDNSGYANAAGSGYDASDNYAVINCFVPAYAEVLNKADGDSISGFYITNAACVYKSVTEGDGMSDKFTRGDYLMLTISNVSDDRKVEYYLADYRSDNDAEHYCLDTWQWVDLRELGNVKNIKFSVSGSQNNDYGLLTPGYFCMDNFNGARVVSEVPAQMLEADGTASLDMSLFFTFDNTEASTKYTIDEMYSVPEGTEIKVSDNSLMISGESAYDMKITVKAVNRGKIQYVSIPVTYVNSIDNAVVDNDKVRYRYSVDGMRIDNNTSVNGVSIVYGTDGSVRKVADKK